MKPHSQSALLVVLGCFAFALSQSRAQTPLEHRHTDLVAIQVGPEDPLLNFREVVLKAWIEIKNKHQDDFFPLPESYRIEDVLAAAYEIALRRQSKQPGDWNDQLNADVIVTSGLLCVLARIFKVPKTADYKDKMAAIAPIVIHGAYDRLLVSLSIRKLLLSTSTATLQEGGNQLPKPEELFNPALLELVRRQRSGLP